MHSNKPRVAGDAVLGIVMVEANFFRMTDFQDEVQKNVPAAYSKPQTETACYVCA